MKDHEAYKEDLSLLVLGDLSDPRAAELEAHLEDCAECRTLRDELRSVTSDLGSLPEGHRASLDGFFEARLAPELPRRGPLRLFSWRMVAGFMLSFSLGFALRAWVAPAVERPASVSQRDRLEEAYRVSTKGQDGLTRALLGLKALSQHGEGE